MNEHDLPEGHNPFGPSAQPGGDNPFRSPAEVAHGVRGSEHVPAGVDPRLYRDAGRVRQVRPVAICLIIHGLLIALLGGSLTFAAFFLATVGPEMLQDDQVDFSNFQSAISWGYGIVGGCLLLLGLVSVFAGIRNFSFRSRTLGIVTMSLGVITSVGVWCAPTAIGLAIWGLIVYLNPSVSRAFEMANHGTKPRDILAMVRKPGT